jgi:phospholipase D3/4
MDNGKRGGTVAGRPLAMVALAFVALTASLIDGCQAWWMSPPEEPEADECKFSLAQSMPDKLVLAPLPAGGSTIKPTHEVLVKMLDDAQESVRIASFYMELTPQNASYSEHQTAKPGADVREAIKRAGERGVNVQIVLDHSNKRFITNMADVEYLKDVAQVKFINMTRLLGGGILHTKFMIVDSSTFYLGSANFDWRAYTHVKEIGVVARNCPALGQDLEKIFTTYWLVSQPDGTLSDLASHMAELQTKINKMTPLVVDDMDVYLSGSPPKFNSGNERQLTGRTDDLNALLEVIQNAKSRIDVSVMNYSPATYWPREYWPVIDNALRNAAVSRNVKVRLLFSKWTQTKPNDLAWYRSLNAIQSRGLKGSIHVKLFEVPAFDDWQKQLPYARVKHDKYMVTDQALFLGTSNWSPDYFQQTCGVSLVMKPTNEASKPQLIQTMRDMFERDFNSEFAHELDA